MEIDRDLPRPTDSTPLTQPMDTSLDLNRPRPDEQDPTAATLPSHALPTKPPPAQDAPSNITRTETTLDATMQQPDQAGTMHNSSPPFFTLKSGSGIAHEPATIPHLQQDLLDLFGLKPLAATVARTDPTTGEKINKMRKSYEGKVKTFGLAGRNRAVKHDHEKSLGLLPMTRWPADEWHNQKVHGRDVRNGLSEATMQKLSAAMQMQPGPVKNTPEHDWEDLLGNEKVKPLPAIDENAKKPVRADFGAKPNGQTNGVRLKSNKAIVTEANRPQRAGKKRSYQDVNFEGYGEGYLDDEEDIPGDLGGDLTDEVGRKGGAVKKRKKVACVARILP